MRARLALASLLLFVSFALRADQLEMTNGDHYNGKVLSLNTNTIVWKSDILGTLNLPRDKVANISLGSAPGTNLARAPLKPHSAQASSLAATNAPQGVAAL